MSLSNITNGPNNNDIWCNELNANILNTINETITNLTVSQIFTPSATDLTIVPSTNRLIMDSDIIMNFGHKITSESGNLILDAAALVQLNEALIFPTIGGTAASMNFFQQDSVIRSFGGPFASNATTILFTRLNNVVTMSIFPILGQYNSNSAAINTTSGIPSVYIPINDPCFIIQVQKNTSTIDFGCLQIFHSTGIIQIGDGPDSGIPFTGTGTQLIGLPNSVNVTYNIVN